MDCTDRLEGLVEMNPDMMTPKNRALRRKGCTKAFTGSTRPKEVYALRSDYEHDEAGVWVKVFMCYNGNTVMMVEFENGELVNTEHYTYTEAKEYWNKMIRHDINMHRDDTCIEGMPLGDVKL